MTTAANDFVDFANQKSDAKCTNVWEIMLNLKKKKKKAVYNLK